MERELDRRTGDGIDVRLLWRPTDDILEVVLDDERTGESFRIVVAPEEALDVFAHPYAYAARLVLT